MQVDHNVRVSAENKVQEQEGSAHLFMKRRVYLSAAFDGARPAT